MTYTFKLARRIARLRASLAAALLVALAACDGDSFDPHPDVDSSDPTASAAFAGGIPFGMSAQPLSEFNGPFNGAKLTMGPNQIMEELQIIRSRAGRVVIMLAGNPRHYTDSEGHFSLSKWKARIDLFKGKELSSYISDGTIIGHFLLDEPNDARNWNGQPVPASTVEEMAKYSKQLWPSMPTIIRARPDYLGYNHQYLDAAWAAYLWRWGNVDAFLKKNVADAQARGLGLVVGMNVVKGGNPNGTWMTAGEVESWGSAMMNNSYPCAFLMYEYDTAFLSSAGMGGAMGALRDLAENRSTRTCRRTMGGGTTPPSEAPEPTPDPTSPPPPSSGIPFGPYGLPVSEIATFSGSVRTVTPDKVLTVVRAARQAGAKVILRFVVNGVSNSDGTFNVTKWKVALDRYQAVDLSSFVSDGTIAGHLLVQDPQVGKAWGGRQIPYATLDEMARYSRQMWPALPTLVHAPAAWLAAYSARWSYLDAASVTYRGRMGDPATWVGREVRAADDARLGLLVGMNVLNGGTSASGLPGTMAGTYAMSATQLSSWGSALVAPSRICGLVLVRYDSGYFGRSDVRNAVKTLGDKARARTVTSCRVR